VSRSLLGLEGGGAARSNFRGEICHTGRRLASAIRAGRHLPMNAWRKAMNEDRFNMDIRKFLKVVGVTSQREIELAVRNALAAGKLAETSLLKPKMTLCIPEIGLEHEIDGEIGLR
jgi:hypothetical protein